MIMPNQYDLMDIRNKALFVTIFYLNHGIESGNIKEKTSQWKKTVRESVKKYVESDYLVFEKEMVKIIDEKAETKNPLINEVLKIMHALFCYKVLKVHLIDKKKLVINWKKFEYMGRE